MILKHSFVVLCFTWCVTQAQPQKCSCKHQPSGSILYSLSLSTPDAKDYCDISWTCEVWSSKTAECALYDYKKEEEKRLTFVSPVVSASFEAIEVESHVKSVKVSAQCPLKKNSDVKDLLCSCENPPTPLSPTQSNQEHQGITHETPETSPALSPLIIGIIIIFAVIFAVCVVVAVYKTLRRLKKKQEVNGQGHQQHHPVPGNNPDEADTIV